MLMYIPLGLYCSKVNDVMQLYNYWIPSVCIDITLVTDGYI